MSDKNNTNNNALEQGVNHKGHRFFVAAKNP